MRHPGHTRTRSLAQRATDFAGSLSAVEVMAAFGLVVLLAYTFNDWTRKAVLAVVWRLELMLAAATGTSITPPVSSPGADQGLVWATVLILYCVLSALLIAQRPRTVPSAEDLLAQSEDAENRPRPGGKAP